MAELDGKKINDGPQKLTKSVIDGLPTPKAGEERREYWDAEITGFGLRVSSSGAKTFIYRRRVKGRKENVKIGEYGAWTPDMARKRAREIAVDFDKGISVNTEKRAARAKGATLGEMFKEYLSSHDLRPNTRRTYEGDIKNHLADWRNQPLQSITPEMVRGRYQKICTGSGTAPANKTMRAFRAVYSFAEGLAEGNLPRNPVKALKGMLKPVDRRKTIIKETDLLTWYKAVQEIENPIVADYFALLLYTGLRREEALQLEWRAVDMDAQTFTVTKEKAKNKQEHTRYMSRQVYSIFQRRLSNRENGFVFPGDGKAGHFRDPRKQIESLIEKTGINFCNHDIRRTFATIADDTVSPSQIKHLLNHSTKGGDVTAGYIILSAEKKMDAEQKMADAIDRLLTPPAEGNVIPIGSSKKANRGATK
jgi:integrase